jgi:hypothetical protein
MRVTVAEIVMSQWSGVKTALDSGRLWSHVRNAMVHVWNLHPGFEKRTLDAMGRAFQRSDAINVAAAGKFWDLVLTAGAKRELKWDDLKGIVLKIGGALKSDSSGHRYCICSGKGLKPSRCIICTPERGCRPRPCSRCVPPGPAWVQQRRTINKAMGKKVVNKNRIGMVFQ